MDICLLSRREYASKRTPYDTAYLGRGQCDELPGVCEGVRRRRDQGARDHKYQV